MTGGKSSASLKEENNNSVSLPAEKRSAIATKQSDKKQSATTSSSKLSIVSMDHDIENCLATETQKLQYTDNSDADMSNLTGRLGINLSKLVRAYHGNSKSLRNQLSDKFDEIEQDYLSYH